MKEPEKEISSKSIIEMLNSKDNLSLQDIYRKLNPQKKPGERQELLSVDETLMLQAIIFNEYKDAADSSSKKIVRLTWGLVIATSVLALAAIITVLCRL